MKRIERVKLYPTAAQGACLQACLGVCRELYNAALEQRRDAWRSRRLSNRNFLMSENTSLSRHCLGSHTYFAERTA